MPDATLQRAFELDRAAAALEAEDHPACLLGVGGEILTVNAAWDAFARLNGGAPGCLGEHLRGRNYFNYVEGLGPRTYYESLWHRVLSGVSVTVEGECNSGATLRDLRSIFRPITLGGVCAVVVAHRVVRQREMSGEWRAPLDLALWVDEEGRLIVCTSCRRVRRTDGSAWDFVPPLVEVTCPAAEHVFCPACAARLHGWTPPAAPPPR